MRPFLLSLFLFSLPVFALAHGEKETDNAATATTLSPSVKKGTALLTARMETDRSVHLQWQQSLNSTDASSYIVQRSADNVNFTNLAQLPATGNRYMYLDDVSGQEGDVFYYRILVQKGKQTSTRSDVVAVGQLPVNTLRMTAEESLSGEALQLNIFTGAGETGALKLMNNNGDLVLQQQLLLTDGYNRILLPDYHQLQTGNYYLTLETSGGLSALKLEK